jgi:ketosteroid isomerase-like protein
MKRLISASLALIAAFIVFACTPIESERTDSVAADTDGVLQTFEKRVSGLDDGDIDLWLSAHATGVRFMNPAGPDIVGIESLRAWGQPFFDGFTMKFNETIEELEVSGTVVYVRYQSDGQMTPKEGGTEIESHQTGLLVFRLDDDGEWRITHNIWTSPVIPEESE